MLHAIFAANSAAESVNPLVPAPYDMIWSGVVFAIILLFFWKKILPNVSALLDARAAAIEGNIEKADIAQREAEAALAQYTSQLAEARSEAGKIRDVARVDGQKIVVEAKEVAVSEAERIIVNAQAQIEAERQAAVVSLRSEVGSLALDLAAGVIGQVLTDGDKSKALVDRFLADLDSSEKAKK